MTDVIVFNVTDDPVNSGDGTAASATLTSDATAPSNNDTVTVNGVVYTFKTALTQAAGEVLIGASASIALDNLKSAVNLTAGSGTTYGSATVIHPTVSATTKTVTTLLFVAKTVGTGGNAYTFAENGTHTSVSGATFAGGVNPTSTVTEGAITTVTSISAANLLAYVAAGAVVINATDTYALKKLHTALRFKLGSYNTAGAEPVGLPSGYV